VSGDFNATSGTFTVQSNGTDILNVTSTLMSPQTDGAISIGSASNAFNDMYLDGSAYVSGNVGIGISSPATPLDVTKAGGGNFVATFQNTTSATPYGVHIKDAASGANGYPLLQVTNSAGSSPYLLVHSGTGNVGIGTSSPSSYASTTLEISGSSTTSDLKMTNTTTGTGNTAGYDLELNGNDINYVNRTASGNQKFWTNSTERLRIGSSGELGIGGANYGTSGQVLTSGGSSAAPSWADAGGSGGLLSVQTFTSSGTYTIPSGATAVKVYTTGGGGGGGGYGGTPGGQGGTGGTSSVASGTESITTVSATGGAGAQGGSTSQSGGSGGIGSNGDINIRGQGGGGGSQDDTGGIGGGSFFGGGNRGQRSSSPNNVGFGGGGPGFSSGNNNGGGGGGGGTAIKFITSVTAGNTFTVTVGAGGTAGDGEYADGGAGAAGVVYIEGYS
jgi:hypothetical protein